MGVKVDIFRSCLKPLRFLNIINPQSNIKAKNSADEITDNIKTIRFVSLFLDRASFVVFVPFNVGI